MRDVLGFAGGSHPVAFDRLGEDHCWFASVVNGRPVGGIHFGGIMSAASQLPDLGVAPVSDHGGRFWIAAEEVLPDVGAVFGLEVLVFAVEALVHELAK